jgi:hypothetical protein
MYVLCLAGEERDPIKGGFAPYAPGYDNALKQNGFVGSAHTRKGPVGPLNPRRHEIKEASLLVGAGQSPAKLKQ